MKRRINLKILAIGILLFAGSVLFYLVYDINNTEKALAHSLLENPMQSSILNLRYFSDPVSLSLKTIRKEGEIGFYDQITPEKLNGIFGSMIHYYPQISSMGIANSEGYEYDVISMDSGFINRIAWIDKWGREDRWSFWELNSDLERYEKVREWKGTVVNDPRDRDWFIGDKDIGSTGVSWTKPYVYNTTNQLGVTASVWWKYKGDERKHVVYADLTLENISKFTSELSISKNGKSFILSGSGEYIGLPKDTIFKNKDMKRDAQLKHVDSVYIPSVSAAYNYQKEIPYQKRYSFEYEVDGDYWWAMLERFYLTENYYIIIGVVIPENDILSEVERTKRVVVVGFVFILILTSMVLYSYGESQKANKILYEKNILINSQKKEILYKNHQITDSIRYAKRIQNAILPPIKNIKLSLPKSFVIYLPKDIVAGDFYWLEKKNDKVLFAVADCTGHGVPGAMVSVVCNNGLNRAVREYHENIPCKILDRTREIVIQEFEKSMEAVQDGMDIALCTLQNDILEYSGANNPLWIIRKGAKEIEIYSADKQPIGAFDKPKPYTHHKVSLNKGDNIYIFSDGIIDQFGGPKGKKYKAVSLKKLLLSIQDETIEKQGQLIEKAYEDWQGDLDQVDDICVIGVQV